MYFDYEDDEESFRDVGEDDFFHFYLDKRHGLFCWRDFWFSSIEDADCEGDPSSLGSILTCSSF